MKVLAISAIVFLLSVSVQSQTVKKNFCISGSNYIGVSMGFLQNTSVVVTGSDVSAKMGFSFGLNYSYGMTEELSLDISAGIITAEVNTYNGFTIGGPALRQKSAFVMPVFAGVKYSPLALSIGPNTRPYVSLHAGPVQGFTSSETYNSYYQLVTENKVESVFGAKAGAGIETAPAKWVRIGIFAGYVYTGDFNDNVGNYRNYSGFDFSLKAGLAF